MSCPLPSPPLAIIPAACPRLVATTAQALEGRGAALLADFSLATDVVRGLGAVEDLGEEEVIQVGEKKELPVLLKHTSYFLCS